MEAQGLAAQGRSARLVSVVLPLLYGPPPRGRCAADQALEGVPPPHRADQGALRAQAISPAAAASARRCCTGPTTAAGFERERPWARCAISNWPDGRARRRATTASRARRGCSFPRWCRLRAQSRACACSTSHAARARRRRRPPMPARGSPASISRPPCWRWRKSLHPEIEFHAGDAEALPFADARFDAAIANFGIHHVERPERAIAEARRVLRRGGTFAFTVWAAPRGQHGLAHHFRCREGLRPPRCPDAGRERFRGYAREFRAARNRSGLRCGNAHQRTAAYDWLLPRDADLVSIFETGTVRMATLLRGQGAALPAVRRHVAEAVQSHRRDGTIVLPTRAWLISAQSRKET